MATTGNVSAKVTSQRPGFGPGPDGRTVEGITVGFETGSGIQGSVFVPRASYGEANVRQMVAQHAAELEAVQAIQIGPKS